MCLCVEGGRGSLCGFLPPPGPQLTPRASLERSCGCCVAGPTVPAASSPRTPTASQLHSPQHACTSPCPQRLQWLRPRPPWPPATRSSASRPLGSELGVFTAVPRTRGLPAPAALGISPAFSAACAPRFPPTALFLAHLRTGTLLSLTCLSTWSAVCESAPEEP